MNEEKIFYVYAYTRLDNNTYFYIGKGKGDRYIRTNGRSKHFKNILNKTECVVEILYNNLTEEEALRIEQETIESLVFEEGYSIEFDDEPNKEGHLVNCTFGGEQRKHCSKPGELNSMYGKKGELSPHYGKKYTEDHKDKIRESNPKSTKCYCVELDREFNSYREASKILKEEYDIICYHSAIGKVCSGERESCGRDAITGLEVFLHFEKC